MVLDGESGCRRHPVELTLRNVENVGDDLFRRRDVAVAVMPGQLGQLQEVKRRIGGCPKQCFHTGPTLFATMRTAVYVHRATVVPLHMQNGSPSLWLMAVGTYHRDEDGLDLVPFPVETASDVQRAVEDVLATRTSIGHPTLEVEALSTAPPCHSLRTVSGPS